MLARLRAAFSDERVRRRAWLVAFVGVLGFYKLELTRHTYVPNIDGGYYTDIAAHVRDGQGLVSSVATLHAGYPYFPFPSAAYPLWPLLFGWAAKMFPIVDAGKWLATAFYFATLGFAYLWGAAIHPRPLFPRFAPGLGAGHVLVLMFGLHDFFFAFTSWPYTEGLSFAIACAALWRMTRLLGRPTWLGGLEVGVWLGLAILARYQMVLMAMAAFPVLAAAALWSSGPRRQYALMTAVAAVGMILVVGPHYLYVRSFTPHLTPGLYVQWQRVRFTDGFSPIPDVHEVAGALPWVADRLAGFRRAFDPRDDQVSYFLRYYTFAYALVAAVPLLGWLGVRSVAGAPGGVRERLQAAWAWVRRPENLHWVYAVVLAAGCFAMIHSMHMEPGRPFPEWYFAQRHAIVCMFAFFLSLLLLLVQERRAWKVAGILILVSGTCLGVASIRAQVLKADGARPPRSSALVAWLNEEAAKRGAMVVVLRQPQPIAYQTPKVGYHWYYGGTTFADVRKMVEMGAAYVIVPGNQSFSFTRSPDFAKAFELVRTVEGNRIYAPVSAAAPQPTPTGVTGSASDRMPSTLP